MTWRDRLKRRAVSTFRRVPPAALRRLRPREVRSVALGALNDVLQAHPVRFSRAKTTFGFTMSGTTKDLLQRYVYVFGAWEPSISHWVCAHLRRGDVVVDVGANVGYFSLLCASRVGPEGEVIAFEPVPSVVRSLRHNLAANAARSVTVVPAIASDEPGDGEIFRSADDNLGRSSTSPGEHYVAEGRVAKLRAADAIEPRLWPRIRLVKVDTEGDELRVLRGLGPVLDEMGSGTAVLVEVTPEELERRGHSTAELVSFMRGRGFYRMLSIFNSYAARDYARSEIRAPVGLSTAPATKTDVIFLKTTMPAAPEPDGVV